MSKRSKTVFPSGEIPHLWVHGRTEYARNSSDNVSTRDGKLFSYAAEIGRIITVNKRIGKRVALLKDQTYSVTTSKHQSRMRQALHGNDIAVFHVDNLDISAEYPNASRSNHQQNLKGYADKIIAAAKTASRARSNREWRINALIVLVVGANGYARTFGYKPRFAVPSDIDLEALKLKAQQEAKRDAAKRAKRNAEMEVQRQAAITKFNAETLPIWLNGGAVDIGWNARDYTGTDYLRVNPAESSELQSSRGAIVPIEHVRRALRLIAALPAGIEWHSNSHTIHVGDYSISHGTADGTVIVGCHQFNRAEVERIASVLASVSATA